MITTTPRRVAIAIAIWFALYAYAAMALTDRTLDRPATCIGSAIITDATTTTILGPGRCTP